MTYDIDFSAVVTAPSGTKTLKVWLPIPQSDLAQKIEASQLSTFPMKVRPLIGTEATYGNRFAYFEFESPQGAQIIRHTFKATIHEMRWNVDPAKVTKVEKWPKSFDKYLRSDQSVVISEQLREIIPDLGAKQVNPADDLASIMQWVKFNIKYDHLNASLKASSEHALKHRAGHCSDYHGLCAAFGRALGYPTRVSYGINTIPKNSPSHCKLKAYLPPYGWVAFDGSETQRLIDSIKMDKSLDAAAKASYIERAVERLRRDFRDNTWLQQTRGTDYDLAPPAKKRVPVVRTIHAEADGVALPEPDPGNAEKREFGWMTIHEYVPNRAVEYPFRSWKSLKK